MNQQEMSFKKILESDDYAAQKAVISREINENKLVIDYSVFKHTEAEKDEKKEVKLNHRMASQKAYGTNWKKHLNVPGITS